MYSACTWHCEIFVRQIIKSGEACVNGIGKVRRAVSALDLRHKPSEKQWPNHEIVCALSKDHLYRCVKSSIVCLNDFISEQKCINPGHKLFFSK